MNKNTYVSNQGIWSIVKGFYTARSKFNSFYGVHKRGKTVDFQNFYNFVKEDMIPLEERAHELLRPDDSIQALMDKHNGEVKGVDLEKDLFDIILGGLHRETEDLLSTIHQANEYKPRLLHHQNTQLDKTESEALNLMMKYVKEAESRIPQKYDEVKELFDDATKILEEHVLPIYKEDMHLLKSIILNQDSDYFKKDGASRVPHIFELMFEDGEFEAYYRAGRSWIDSSQIGDAVESFTKALDVYEEQKGNPGFLQGNRQKLIGMIAIIPKEGNHKLLERIQNLVTNPS